MSRSFKTALLEDHRPDQPQSGGGYRVEEINDPLMQQFRYLDKLVDELAKGKRMEKILRN